jgi:adenylyltransferase/sulfurtransferase
MNETDRRLVAERRSCAMLARRFAAAGQVPSTAVAASVVGALQAAEALHLLHGRSGLAGEGLFINGHDFSRVRFQRRDDCFGHDSWGEVEPLGAGVAEVTVGELLARAERELGAGATLDFSRDLVLALRCPECGAASPGRAVLGEIGEGEARCPGCGGHRLLEIASSAYRGGPVDLEATPGALGLPPFDVVLARRGLDRRRAWLFDADAPAVLGPLAAEDGP